MRAGYREEGFTLLEIMVAVVVLALLASIAIPAYTKYIVKSRSVEAADMLAKIATGAQMYWDREHPDSNIKTRMKGKTKAKMVLTTHIFPSNSKGYTPNKSWKRSCKKASGTFGPWLNQFKKEPWNSLRFWPTGVVRFRYRWRVKRQRKMRGKALAQAYAEAKADLRCNGKYTTFRVYLQQDKKTGGLEKKGPAQIEGF